MPLESKLSPCVILWIEIERSVHSESHNYGKCIDTYIQTNAKNVELSYAYVIICYYVLYHVIYVMLHTINDISIHPTSHEFKTARAEIFTEWRTFDMISDRAWPGTSVPKQFHGSIFWTPDEISETNLYKMYTLTKPLWIWVSVNIQAIPTNALQQK